MLPSFRIPLVAFTLVALSVPRSLAEEPAVVARGAYPDLALDAGGGVHLVYVRDGVLFYRVRRGEVWSDEESTGLASGLVSRSDPEIAIDSQGRPHVLVGSSYAHRGEGGGWSAIDPGVSRDTALAIDSSDTVYVCRRGGHNGGYLGVRKRAAGSGQFTALPDPDIDGGLPLGRNDHVYGHLFVSPSDDSLHVVYRHGAPTDFAYRASTDGGQSWLGGGVSGDDAEAPSGAAGADGAIYVIGGAGTVFRRSGTPSQWESLGRAVGAVGRDLPSLAVGGDGTLYVTSFGGRFNVGAGGEWSGEGVLPRLSNLPLGFAEVAAGSGDHAYVVWEEGDGVDSDAIADTSDILFATIGADGTVGGGSTGTDEPPAAPQNVTVR